MNTFLEDRPASWYDGYKAGIRYAINVHNRCISDAETMMWSADALVENLQTKEDGPDGDRCLCEDCLSENPVVFDFGDDADAPEQAPPAQITGFVVCVNDEPYQDTFSEDASITWQLFLPILEADPGLGNEDVRLVRLTEE